MLASPIGWVGGKRRLRQQILQRIHGHDCYVEVFAGGAWVLFGKPPSAQEVLNDINDELVNFYLVIQTRHEEFLRALEYLLPSRALWEDYLHANPLLLDPMTRAVRFFYLIRLSFGKRMKNFGTSTERRIRLHLDRMMQRVQAWHGRLRDVTIEHLHYWRCIEVYDRAHTFFYLDPPFVDANEYGYKFDEADHHRLRDVLGRTKGKWLLSYGEHDLVTDLYRGFRLERLRLRYSIGRTGRDLVRTELLIRNY